MSTALRALSPRLLPLMALTAMLATPLAAQGGPPPEVRAMLDGVVEMLRDTADASLAPFVEKRMAPEYREAFSETGLLDHLRALRARVAEGDGTVSARGTPGSIIFSFDAAGAIRIRVDWNDDLKVTKLEEIPEDA